MSSKQCEASHPNKKNKLYTDGWDCLGVVHEARGENRQAADCYRKMTDIMRQHPNDHDTGYEEEFAMLIARLDPSAAT